MDMLCQRGGGGIIEALNATVYGNGTQTLVLSHGFGLDQKAWHFLIPSLTLYFKLSVKKTIYMGHSMSAMIGCIAATKRPDLFRHLILLDGSPRYLNAEGYYGGFETSVLDQFFEQIMQDYPAWVQTFAPIAIGSNNSKAIDELERSLRRLTPDIALSVAKTVFLSDERSVLPLVKVPSTIIQSREDLVAPTFVACYLRENLGGNATVEILETRGHIPQLTAPDLLLGALNRSFIRFKEAVHN